MAKTRSRVLSATVKREEQEDKFQLEQLLHSTNKATKNKNKVEKNRKPIQAQNAQVNSENVDVNKVVLTSLKKTFKGTNITKEKISKLISYVVNDQIPLIAASRKAGISYSTARRYYREYRSDPESKVPLPKTRKNTSLLDMTQDKIDSLIRYIFQDGMSVSQASTKVNIPSNVGATYYAKYLEDPERKTPLLNVCGTPKRYKKEEIADLIHSIVRDKMTIAEASKKANMSRSTAKKYYLKYLNNPNHEIPDPNEYKLCPGKPCTNDQIKSLIEYIVSDGMTLLEASIKIKMDLMTARKYYKQYLDDPEKNIPTTTENKKSSAPRKISTLDQVKHFFHYVIIDKLNVTRAARKAKIAKSSAWNYYDKYLKSPNNQIKIKDMSYSSEKMKRLVELVQNEKMSLKAASDAVHLNTKSAHKYYQAYLKDPHYEFPVTKKEQYSQENIQRLIHYIERDKMSVKSAATITKMDVAAAYKYYKEYQNDPEHKNVVRNIKESNRKNRIFDRNMQIIADIYKNYPSIKPIHESHHSELDGSFDINIKQEDKKNAF